MVTGGLLVARRAAATVDEVHWTMTGQTSVTFDWRGGEEVIHFGAFPGGMSDSVVAVAPTPMPDSSPGPFWEAKLTGLRQNTLYSYRIGSQTGYAFRTPILRGSTDYWFVEEADIGSTHVWANVGITQDMLLDDNTPGVEYPRFVLAPGDLSYGDQGILSDVDQHFNDVMAWSQIAAYMPAWGNHEWALASDNVVDNLNNYEGRFDFPHSQTSPGADQAVGNGSGKDWYWFDYGNVRFIAFPEPYTGAWADWAVNVDPIMADAQRDPAIDFIITFGHRPSWSSGADHPGETQLAGYMQDLHSHHSKYVLSIQAHSHHYERCDPAQTGGLLFIVGPGGGSSLGGLTTPQPSWSVYRINHLEHMRIHVQRARIDGYVICGPDGSGSTDSCAQGTVIDSWTVLAPTLVGVPDKSAQTSVLRVTARPNPARGPVALRADAPAPGEQVLEVLDLSGRLVRRLLSGWQETGSQAVLWDGNDASGVRAPAGIYTVRLRSGDRSAETRIAILR